MTKAQMITSADNPLAKFVDERVKKLDRKLIGLTLPSGNGIFFREMSLSSVLGAITNVIDLQIRGESTLCERPAIGTILRNVPISMNNSAIAYTRYVQAPVELSKSETGKLEVTGLSKRGPAIVARKAEVSLVSGSIIPGSEQNIGIQVWPIEYGDLGADSGAAPDGTGLDGLNGYGTKPYGAFGLYDGDGNFVELMGQ